MTHCLKKIQHENHKVFRMNEYEQGQTLQDTAKMVLEGECIYSMLELLG